jgi:hypothetical protein
MRPAMSDPDEPDGIAVVGFASPPSRTRAKKVSRRGPAEPEGSAAARRTLPTRLPSGRGGRHGSLGCPEATCRTAAVPAVDPTTARGDVSVWVTCVPVDRRRSSPPPPHLRPVACRSSDALIFGLTCPSMRSFRRSSLKWTCWGSAGLLLEGCRDRSHSVVLAGAAAAGRGRDVAAAHGHAGGGVGEPLGCGADEVAVQVDAVGHAEDDVLADLVAEHPRRRLDLQGLLDLLDQVLGQLVDLLLRSFSWPSGPRGSPSRVFAGVVHQVGHVLAEADVGQLVAGLHQLVQLGDVLVVTFFAPRMVASWLPGPASDRAAAGAPSTRRAPSATSTGHEARRRLLLAAGLRDEVADVHRRRAADRQEVRDVPCLVGRVLVGRGDRLLDGGPLVGELLQLGPFFWTAAAVLV